MKLRVEEGGFRTFNQRRVYAEDGVEVGTVHVRRMPGWREGRRENYSFFPNAEGTARGLVQRNAPYLHDVLLPPS